MSTAVSGTTQKPSTTQTLSSEAHPAYLLTQDTVIQSIVTSLLQDDCFLDLGQFSLVCKNIHTTIYSELLSSVFLNTLFADYKDTPGLTGWPLIKGLHTRNTHIDTGKYRFSANAYVHNPTRVFPDAPSKIYSAVVEVFTIVDNVLVIVEDYYEKQADYPDNLSTKVILRQLDPHKQADNKEISIPGLRSLAIESCVASQGSRICLGNEEGKLFIVNRLSGSFSSIDVTRPENKTPRINQIACNDDYICVQYREDDKIVVYPTDPAVLSYSLDCAGVKHMQVRDHHLSVLTDTSDTKKICLFDLKTKTAWENFDPLIVPSVTTSITLAAYREQLLIVANSYENLCIIFVDPGTKALVHTRYYEQLFPTFQVYSAISGGRLFVGANCNFKIFNIANGCLTRSFPFLSKPIGFLHCYQDKVYIVSQDPQAHHLLAEIEFVNSGPWTELKKIAEESCSVQ